MIIIIIIIHKSLEIPAIDWGKSYGFCSAQQATLTAQWLLQESRHAVVELGNGPLGLGLVCQPAKFQAGRWISKYIR